LLLEHGFKSTEIRGLIGPYLQFENLPVLPNPPPPPPEPPPCEGGSVGLLAEPPVIEVGVVPPRYTQGLKDEFLNWLATRQNNVRFPRKIVALREVCSGSC